MQKKHLKELRAGLHLQKYRGTDMELFYTYNTEVKTIQTYSKQDIINRINDYIYNYDEDEAADFALADETYSIYDIIDKLSNTWWYEKVFLVDDNGYAIYKNSRIFDEISLHT